MKYRHIFFDRTQFFLLHVDNFHVICEHFITRTNIFQSLRVHNFFWNEAKALPIPLINRELKEFEIHGAKLQT
jgi:hypothetical protein